MRQQLALVLVLFALVALAGCTPDVEPAPTPAPVTVVVTVILTPTPLPVAPVPTFESPLPTGTAVPAPAVAVTGTAAAVSSPQPLPTGVSTVPAATVEPTPTGPTPTPCAQGPGGMFSPAWTAASLQWRLGCAVNEQQSLLSSYEPFQNGFMFWREDTRQIYVLYNDGTWQVYDDTWEEGDPEFSCPDANTPSAVPPTPHRGFGKLWCTEPEVRSRLGTALLDEIGADRFVQDFENGTLLLIPERSGRPIALFVDTNTWREV